MQSRRYHDIAVFVLRSVVVGLAAAFVLTVFAPGLVERLRGSPGVTAGVTMGSATAGAMDGMKQPAVWRREQASEQVRAMQNNGVETYDIPAFLRKQAD